MKPQDFMEFRDYLVPASGFQSIQFRQIELKLGLKQNFRLKMDKDFFNSRLALEDQEKMLQLEKETTLLEMIDAWLSRMPFGKTSNYDFWEKYQETIEQILNSDEEIINNNKTLSDKQRQFELRNLQATRDSFAILFDEEKYQKLRDEGAVRISRQAKLSAIFINLFKDEPIFQMPNSLLQKLIDIDELFTTWRYRHVIMVHRMLGSKIGTGGSSGHDYLKKTTDNNRVFVDFFNLATYLLPKSKVPDLPEDVRDGLGFTFRHSDYV
jgi:tryptophan 2,3-dioxygenase